MNDNLLHKLKQYAGINDNPDQEGLDLFAELIAKECVRYFNEDYQRDFDIKWREDLTKNIKEHFGVKERNFGKQLSVILVRAQKNARFELAQKLLKKLDVNYKNYTVLDQYPICLSRFLNKNYSTSYLSKK